MAAKQVAAYDPESVFQKILDGVIPSFKIFETEHVLAILDAFPVGRHAMSNVLRVLRKGSALVARGWEYFQVELHEKYSVERLYNFRVFTERTSSLRAALALLLTPVPCLVVVVGTELIPLQPPEDGLSSSQTFWIRVFLVTWLMNFTVLEQCRFLIPQLPMCAPENALVSLFSSSGGTWIGFGLSYAIGYPLPFLMAFGSPGCCAFLGIAVTVIWGEHIRGDPAVQAELKNYVLVASAQLAMTYAYPAYNFAFVSLRGASQTAFAILLPFMKILAKNVLNYLFAFVEGLKSEMVIFNVEIFHALFVSYCMQNASSIESALVLMTVDFIQACLSLYDVEQALRVIHKVVAETQEAVKAERREQHLQPRPKSRKKSLFRRSFERPEFVRPDKGDREFIEAMIEANKVLYVQKMLQLLYLTEFLLLIEFTEVIIPIVYCIYTSTVSNLPNRAHYPQLRDIDNAKLASQIGNVLVYASLEVLSFLFLTVMMHRKLKISPVRQLAFVLIAQWQFVQSKLILWVVFSVQTTLQHFGVDYSFRLAWLRSSQ
ncbi:hypothetical protein PybrP1_004649 [[Pythium] brassicae (nom. inval.)]|nr:hypothetical protein PybrP1_004649 [[Pythium] brassicae (nom. inval.)]